MTTFEGRAWIDGEFREATIRIDGPRFAEVTKGSISSGRALALILPGFIDIHVHGGAGADFMDGTAEAAHEVARFHATHGTTSLAATTLSGSRASIRAAVRAAATAAGDPRRGAAEIAAIHLEGPYLAPARAGAQDRGSLRPADAGEIEEWIEAAGGLPILMTVAPEREGVLQAVEQFSSRILFSIGHTEAGFDRCREAIALGASHFTHLGNAMPAFHQREQGPIGAAIDSPKTTAELIADGVHLHRVMLQSIARLVPGRVALVTDAIRACGMGDGSWRLGDLEAVVEDGIARLGDGTLAGSLLTMDRAVKTMVELAGLPIEDVIPMVTEVPAGILGVAGRKGRIAPGLDADLVVMNDRLGVERVFARGIEVASGQA